MLDSIVRTSIVRRWLVLGLTFLAAGHGAYSFLELPIDAVPDITNVQVQINTEAPGYSPLEAEQRVTFPIETTSRACRASTIRVRSRATASRR
jgi:cobalt-zinc-cadmium resistance protein CzcA